MNRFTFVLMLAATSASAGEVLDSYLPHMRSLADWQQINWADQHAIAKEVATTLEHQLDFNVCMDMSSEDIRFKNMPFGEGLRECLKASEPK